MSPNQAQVAIFRGRAGLGVLALAAALRVALALQLPAEPIFADGERFNEAAYSLLRDHSFPARDQASAPLHPIVLAVVYGMTGTSQRAARLVAAGVGVLAVFLVGRLGGRLFGAQVGLLAATGLAFYPMHIYVSALHEYPTGLFIVLLIWTLDRALAIHYRPGSRRGWLLCGLGLGLSALTVPTVLTAAPLLATWLLFSTSMSLLARAIRAGLIGAACIVVLLPWSVYRYRQTGDFHLVTGAGAETLFKGNCELAWDIGKADVADRYEMDGVPPDRRVAYTEYVEVERAAHSVPAGSARDAVYRTAVDRFWRERPRRALSLLARKAAIYWLPYARTVTRSHADSPIAKVAQTVAFVPIMLLAVVGGYWRRDCWRCLLGIYVIVLSQWLTYSIFLPTARYRLHIDPFLIVLAASAVGLAAQRGRLADRHRREPRAITRSCGSTLS